MLGTNDFGCIYVIEQEPSFPEAGKKSGGKTRKLLTGNRFEFQYSLMKSKNLFRIILFAAGIPVQQPGHEEQERGGEQPDLPMGK